MSPLYFNLLSGCAYFLFIWLLGQLVTFNRLDEDL